MTEPAVRDPDTSDPRSTGSPDTEGLDPARLNEFIAWKEWREFKEWTEWTAQRNRVVGPASTSRSRYASTPIGMPFSHFVRAHHEGAESSAQEKQEKVHAQADDASSQPETKYVLSGAPTGWAAMAKVVREFDEEKVKDCKEDIDTLLVFAGLFSAVLSAFIIVAYPSLQNTPDTSGQMLNALERVVNHTAGYTLSEGVLNSTGVSQPISQPAPSAPSSNAIRVNVLWFASLLLSLMAASFAILVKQWLREYLAVQNPSPQARLRVRHLRYPQLAIWKVFEIAAILPLLVQLSLGLFFVGMCYFTSEVHSSIGHTAIPLVAGWAAFFFGFTLLPIIVTRCPYRTPLLKSVNHRWLYNLLVHPEEEQENASPQWRKLAIAIRYLWRTVCASIIRYKEENDEKRAVARNEADMDILAAVDAIQSNDELLATTMSEIVGQMSLPELPQQLRAFILSVLRNRVPLPKNVSSLRLPLLPLSALSPLAANTLADLIGHCLQSLKGLPSSHLQAKGSDSLYLFIILMSLFRGRTKHDVSRTAGVGLQIFRKFLRADGPAICAALTQAAIDLRQPEDAVVQAKVDKIVDCLTDLLDVVDLDLNRSIENLQAILRKSVQFHRRDSDFVTREARMLRLGPQPVAETFEGAAHLWSFRIIAPIWRRRAIIYLLTCVERNLNDYIDGDTQRADLNRDEAIQSALTLMFSLLIDLPLPGLSERLPPDIENLAFFLAGLFKYKETTRLVLASLGPVPHQTICSHSVMRVLREIPAVVSRDYSAASRMKYLSNIGDVVTSAIRSTEVIVSVPQALRFCLVAVFFIETGPFHATARQRIWVPLFRNLTNYITQRAPNESSDMSKEIETLANECLCALDRVERAERDNSGWTVNKNEEQYCAWRDTFMQLQTFFEDDFIDILARLCPGWDEFWRVRLVRERIAIRSAESGALLLVEGLRDEAGDLSSYEEL